ncbi:ROK family protein [Propionimicrobium sp. PCR01-08-3]|uniref:ROK family transcriptional regulator n=1 Tax=Propionimicrobium sp. PCR01-08-3 TaxID=3052086 RepID=UPI00255C7AB0|nr:ROK family protein [Propionimicrobium sp. PCR01-08-3]WIY81877.1 ROK family protein [Propionimicrobium sp. PCR01-08-3]
MLRTIIEAGGSATRSEIARATELSRPTVDERVTALTRLGLARATTARNSTGGRPASSIEFAAERFISLCVDIGERYARVAFVAFGGKIIAQQAIPIDLTVASDHLLSNVVVAATELQDGLKPEQRQIAGVGVGVPAPVDYPGGRTVGWSVMSGWSGFDIAGYFRDIFGVPTFVDNDVNLLLLAESETVLTDVEHVLFVKIGQGIGSALKISGAIDRGADGAAGDIGHVHVAGREDIICRCGKRGCLEALAGGWALARDFAARESSYAGIDAGEVADVIQHGTPLVMDLVHEAAQRVGEAVAVATSLLNPQAIIIGGRVGCASDQFVAAVRSVVYERSLPLATRKLSILNSQLDDTGGVRGAALLVEQNLLSEEHIDDLALRKDAKT